MKKSDVTPEKYYGNGYAVNPITGIDKFGRVILPSKSKKSGKHHVGIFYFLFLGTNNDPKIYNVSEILSMPNGVELLTHMDTDISPNNKRHFWGEPLYGYYNDTDEWIVRRHLKLLAMAGIDFIVFDTTNASTKDEKTFSIMKIICELREQGWNVPQAAFYFNTKSIESLNYIYEKLYSKGLYRDAWYCIEGKPLIISNIDPEFDRHMAIEAYNNPEIDYYPDSPADEILNFFAIRDSQWPTEEFKDNGFPWIEFEYPAKPHNGVISVAVSAHVNFPFSETLTRGNINWGRGWNVETKKNEKEGIEKGSYYQSTWNNALNSNANTVFICGWNEWVAGKHISPKTGEYVLVDQLNQEYSRDAEMMKGGHKDAFYIQTVMNSKRFKTEELLETEQLGSTCKDVFKVDWDNVKAVYRDMDIWNKGRNSCGVIKSLVYTQAPARNNVTEIRVATDENNIAFHLKVDCDITSHKSGDSSWMNIFIGTGCVSDKGWESFEYVINRDVISEGIGSVEKLKSDFSGENVGSAKYIIEKDTMVITVSKSYLGLKADDNKFYFKFADNIIVPNDIMDYYVSGKSMPIGRLSYQYIGE